MNRCRLIGIMFKVIWCLLCPVALMWCSSHVSAEKQKLNQHHKKKTPSVHHPGVMGRLSHAAFRDCTLSSKCRRPRCIRESSRKGFESHCRFSLLGILPTGSLQKHAFSLILKGILNSSFLCRLCFQSERFRVDSYLFNSLQTSIHISSSDC